MDNNQLGLKTESGHNQRGEGGEIDQITQTLANDFIGQPFKECPAMFIGRKNLQFPVDKGSPTYARFITHGRFELCPINHLC